MSLLRARLLAAERDRQARRGRRDAASAGGQRRPVATHTHLQLSRRGESRDHRINLTLYKLAMVMAGELDQIIDPLVNEHQAEQLAALAT